MTSLKSCKSAAAGILEGFCNTSSMKSIKRYFITFLCCLAAALSLYAIFNKLDYDVNSSKNTKYSIRGRSFSEKQNYQDLQEDASYNITQAPTVNTSENSTNEYRSDVDYSNFQPGITSINFQKCRMTSCFDSTRCRTAGPIKVHIVASQRAQDQNITIGENNLIYQSIMKIIRTSRHFEPDPNRACIFIPEDDTLDRDPLSQSFRPNLTGIFNQDNFYGLNHLAFNLYSGTWPDYEANDFAGLQVGAVILAKASSSILHHRAGYDISLPLFSHLHPCFDADLKQDYNLTSISQRNRTFFLTFKGKRYVFGSGSETRNNLHHIDNGRDVIMLTTCRHGKKWRESSDARCMEEEKRYNQYDYDELMKDSVFCLTPRGRRLGSFRFLEALSYGCIPVVLSDGWIRPFDEIIDWSSATLQYEESLVLQVPDMLRDIDKKTVIAMRNKCLEIYRKYFSTTQRIILTTLSIIERRLKNHLDAELRKQT